MSAGLCFRRPIGAAADVKELEYIVALHQTSIETRPNATVSSLDVMALLKSRYGLTITHSQAIRVVRTLGGGDTSTGGVQVHSVKSNVDGDDAEKGDEGEPSSKSDGFIQGAWHKTTNMFHHKTYEAEENEENKQKKDSCDIEGEIKFSSKENGNGGNNEKNNDEATRGRPKLERSSGHLTRFKKLKEYHASIEKGNYDDKMLQDLRQELASDLQKRVLKKAAAARRLLVTKLDDGDDDNRDHAHNSECHDSQGHYPLKMNRVLEVDDENEEEQSGEYDQPQKDKSPDEGPGMDKHEEEKPVVELAEYLDLAQILSVLLIPAISRMARETMAENEEAAAAKMARPNASGGDTEDNPKNDDDGDDKFWFLGGCFWRCFVAYGRRKLGLKDDQDISPLASYTSKQLLYLAREALCRGIPGAGDGSSLVVDEALVRLLLLNHGEIERAADLKLVREMVALANKSTCSAGLFDEQSVIDAISSDLGCWDSHVDEIRTTFFYDVFGVDVPSSNTKLVADEKDVGAGFRKSRVVKPAMLSASQPATETVGMKGSAANHNESNAGFRGGSNAQDRKATVGGSWFCCKHVNNDDKASPKDFSTLFLGVDFVTDMFSSTFVQLLIWSSFVLSMILYAPVFVSRPRKWIERNCASGDTWCNIADTCRTWLALMFVFVVYGVYHILPLSVGNHPANKSFGRQVFASVFAAASAIWPYLLTEWIEDHATETGHEDLELTFDSQYYIGLQYMALGIGLFLSLIYGIQALMMLIGNFSDPSRLPLGVGRWLTSASSWNNESRIYKATRLKIKNMLANALHLHEDQLVDTERMTKKETLDLARARKGAASGTREKAMRNFVVHGEAYEPVGGTFYMWWRLFDGSLLKQEGLWVSTRLKVTLAIQAVALLFWTIILSITTRLVAKEADEFRSQLVGLPDWVMEIFPTGAMVRQSLGIGTLVAFVVMTVIVIIYIPSSMATVLKFRAGILPSLGSASFQKYRIAVDLTYLNTGNALFGMLGSAFFFYLVIGLLVFLLVWPITQKVMYGILTTIAGLAITICAKVVLTLILRKIQYRAYYRVKPASARISALVMECWSLPLLSFVVFSRLVQFIGAALFWMGRIDVSFLDENVNLFGYAFDYAPTHYWKDLLVHEAHRHPYIERLAQMYLMKLRYGDRFANEAGCVWRQLLVISIFPWIAKYRVFTDERRISAEIDAEELEEQVEKENSRFNGVKEMRASMMTFARNVESVAFDIGREVYGAGEDMVTTGRKATTSDRRLFGKGDGAKQKRNGTFMDDANVEQSVEVEAAAHLAEPEV